MEQELNSNKTPARPSHQAIENKIGSSKVADRTEREKMDQVGMKAAKRAENRMVNNEEKIPGSKIFSK